MVALFDHEEVGSDSAQGAGSPAMLNTLSRITSSSTIDSKLLEKAIQRSFLVSANMAHALHPNYIGKHEENHQPKLHGGLVIKHNATNAVTALIFREIARNHSLPVQDLGSRRRGFPIRWETRLRLWELQRKLGVAWEVREVTPPSIIDLLTAVLHLQALRTPLLQLSKLHSRSNSING
ncbi:aspartyl aminopeptidase [Pyrus ussuriensis x Pyrus communis]|uniref:Aspartyl aminopeptidase n=1 Tax=Pyrus ussuriensis x Pyrus communis TaxID=2448454 RepID=A0A5N5H783_9ROSA|nr:aspartyl aminopeptidase [Pyrus ussuriensis x Pyrus communis]